MIDPKLIVGLFKNKGWTSVFGVPDSLLKGLIQEISSAESGLKHISCANEGSAIGMAIGAYLATNKPSVVYMQNSGIGNSINPLTSLAAKEIYQIPILLIIGWRGEVDEFDNQIADEPQHRLQGRVTLDQLRVNMIPYSVIDEDSDLEAELLKANNYFENESAPYALVVRRNTFSCSDENIIHKSDLLTREEALIEVLSQIPAGSKIVSTTGMLSRELYEYEITNSNPHRCFLTVGGMGHASSISASMSMFTSDKIYCFDGDGASLMHMGAMATSSRCSNLIHVIFNNRSHDSVGGQPTANTDIDFSAIARPLGYTKTYATKYKNEIRNAVKDSINSEVSCLIEVFCSMGARKNLGRPKESPINNKIVFMGH